MPKSRLLEAEIGDLARPVKVVTGLRMVGIVLMVLDIPDQVYRCQHGVNISSLLPSDPGSALNAVAFAYGAWLADRPLVAPVAFAVEAVVSVIFFTAWVRLGSRIAATWAWLVVEAGATLGLLYVYGWSAISITVIISTVMLLALCAGRRGAIVGAGFVAAAILVATVGVLPSWPSDRATTYGVTCVLRPVAGPVASFSAQPQIISAAITGCCVVVGLLLRSLSLSQGRESRRQVGAQAAEAATRERIRAAEDVHDGLSKTLNGSRMIATALQAELADQADPGHGELAGRLVDTLTEATRESRALLLRLRGETPPDMSQDDSGAAS